MHPYGAACGLCTVTGEPMHDIINLRRAAPPAKNDYWGLVFYHIGMLNRVSAEPAEAAFRHAVGAPELPGGTQHLLREIVEQHREAACRAVLENPGAADALRVFLRHPGVRMSPTWVSVFGSTPPRGTLARVARRLGVQLPQSCQAWAWKSRDDFVGEARLIMRWYETGRNRSRRRLGIIRRRHDAPRVVGIN